MPDDIQGDLFGSHQPPSLRQQFDDGTYPEGFWEWIELNGHIYDGFVRLARVAKSRGIERWSSDAICHVLRWKTALRERGQSVLKINDHATAGLSRLAMAREPDLAGFFTKRTPPARGDAIRLDGSRYHGGDEESVQ